MQRNLALCFVLLLAATACGRAKDGVSAPSAANGGIETKSVPPVAPTLPTVGQIGQVNPAVPLNPELTPLPPPPALSPGPASSPAPQACPGGPEPSVLALDPNDGIIDIALSPTHVYWTSRDTIHRIAKEGGSPELVTSIKEGSSGVHIAGNMLYWVYTPNIFAMPLDGSAPPQPIARDLATPLAWLATDNRVYYMAPTPGDTSGGVGAACAGYQLKSVSSTGEDPQVLAEHRYTDDPIVGDATGLYWSEASSCATDNGIDKYTFATASVSTFVGPTQSGYAQSLRVAGGRLLWFNDAGIWSSPIAGGEPVLLAQPPLVRGLATDGTAAYWAASDLDDAGSFDASADVFSAPLAGGASQKLGCHVYGIEEFWFLADEQALYYRSWIHDLLARLPTSGGADAGSTPIDTDAGTGRTARQ